MTLYLRETGVFAGENRPKTYFSYLYKNERQQAAFDEPAAQQKTRGRARRGRPPEGRRAKKRFAAVPAAFNEMFGGAVLTDTGGAASVP